MSLRERATLIRGKKSRRIAALERRNAELNQRNRTLTTRLAIFCESDDSVFAAAVLRNVEHSVALVDHAKSVKGRREVLEYLGKQCAGMADDLKLGYDLRPRDGPA